jgi:hypothetical protein
MGDREHLSSYKKIVEFIPFKTLSMDLESILSSLARSYMSRNDADMVELIALSNAELFPVGSFDPQAERYEYVLKLAVPVQFFNHLRNGIDKVRQQLLEDITAVTAPYLHEFISEVFVVIQIEQDSSWRDAVLDRIYKKAAPGSQKAVETDIALLHAPTDGYRIVAEMKSILTSKGLRVNSKPFSSTQEKAVEHVLTDFERTSRYGVCVVSKAFLDLFASHESINQVVAYILDPGRKLCQIWDNVSRADVANLNTSLTRSLAYSTERMSTETICDYIVQLAALK